MFSASASQLWYSIPLALSMSLVYSATRFEEMRSILRHAAKNLFWLGGAAVIAFVLLRYWTYPL